MSVTEDPCRSEHPPSAKGRLVPAATVPFPPGRGPQARVGHAGAECAQDTWGREGETCRQGWASRARPRGWLSPLRGALPTAGGSALPACEAQRPERLSRGTRLRGFGSQAAGAGGLCTPLSPLPHRLPGVHGTHVRLQGARRGGHAAADALGHSRQAETSRYSASSELIKAEENRWFSWEHRPLRLGRLVLLGVTCVPAFSWCFDPMSCSSSLRTSRPCNHFSSLGLQPGRTFSVAAQGGSSGLENWHRV